jgi:hypothetical protein
VEDRLNETLFFPPLAIITPSFSPLLLPLLVLVLLNENHLVCKLFV